MPCCIGPDFYLRLKANSQLFNFMQQSIAALLVSAGIMMYLVVIQWSKYWMLTPLVAIMVSLVCGLLVYL